MLTCSSDRGDGMGISMCVNPGDRWKRGGNSGVRHEESLRQEE